MGWITDKVVGSRFLTPTRNIFKAIVIAWFCVVNGKKLRHEGHQIVIQDGMDR